VVERQLQRDVLKCGPQVLQAIADDEGPLLRQRDAEPKATSSPRSSGTTGAGSWLKNLIISSSSTRRCQAARFNFSQALERRPSVTIIDSFLPSGGGQHNRGGQDVVDERGAHEDDVDPPSGGWREGEIGKRGRELPPHPHLVDSGAAHGAIGVRRS
jgi:hypothetical protein